MTKSNQATLSALAVSSAKRETALNQEQALSSVIRVGLGDVLATERRIEDDSNEATGYEEATQLYRLGGTVTATINAEKLTPHVAAFLLAFGLGSCDTSNPSGSVQRHTITPIDGDLDAERSNPTFTAAQKVSDIGKRLFASVMVNSLTMSFVEDEWCKASAELVGTGKSESNLLREDVAGTSDAVSVVLAANAVEGANAAGRLKSVHHIQWKKDGTNYWEPVAFSAASADTPAQITITPPDAGNTDAGTYRVYYVPDETSDLATGALAADPDDDTTGVLDITPGGLTPDAHVGRWAIMTSGTASGRFFKITANAADTITCAGVNLYTAGVRTGDTVAIRQLPWVDLPAEVLETPLRVSQVEVVVGGYWDGAAFQGGRTISAHLGSVEYQLQNSIEPKLGPGAGQDQFANKALRDARQQTLSLSRSLRDAVFQYLADLDQPEYFGVRVKAEGAVIEGAYRYAVDLVWPRVGVTDAKLGLNGKRYSEDVSFKVLEDATYGSVVAVVTNEQTGYAA